MTKRMRTTARAIAVLATAGLAIGLGGCASGAADGVTTLNFFQFKGEALEDFNQMIADFEAENPDIRIVQNQVADADTLIRTLLVKDRIPDIVTLNANGNFGRLARGGGVPRLLRRAGAGDHQPGGAGDPRRPRHLRRRGQRARLRQQRQRRHLQRDDLRRAGPRGARDVGRVHRGVRRAEGSGHHTVLRHARRLVDRDAVVERAGSVSRAGRLLRQAAGPGNRRRPGLRGVVPEELRRDDGPAVHPLLHTCRRDTAARRTTRATRRSRTARSRCCCRASGRPTRSSRSTPTSRWASSPTPGRTTPTTACSSRASTSSFTMGKNSPKQEAAMRFIDYAFQKDVIEEFAASQNMVPVRRGRGDQRRPGTAVGQAVSSTTARSPASSITSSRPRVPLIPIDQEFLFNGDARGRTQDTRQRVAQGRRSHDSGHDGRRPMTITQAVRSTAADEKAPKRAEPSAERRPSGPRRRTTGWCGRR